MTTKGDDARQQPEEAPLPAPAKIKLLYESRDGKLCMFEDAQGHLTVVRSEKLA